MSTRSERIRDEAREAHKRRMENSPPPVDPNLPLCVCGANMVKRWNSYKEQYFWGCRTYPVCKHTKWYKKDEKI